MEITPVILKDVLYDMKERVFYCKELPVIPLKPFDTPIPFSKEIPDVSGAFRVERPTYVMNTLHYCFGHAYVDITISNLSVLHEYSPEILENRGFQLFVLKDSYQEISTDEKNNAWLDKWEEKNIDMELGTYKGVYSHFHKCFSDSPILFEKSFSKCRYIQFDTIIYGGSMDFQRAIHNSAERYPGRRLTAVATDEQTREWIRIGKEVFGKYIGVKPKTPSENPNILFIARKGAREFVNKGQRKLAYMLELQPVYLEDFTFEEQIQMFVDADIIISPHGSGLLHSLWCSPGTRLIEIFGTDDSRKRIFESYSEFLGLEYKRIECSTESYTTDAPVDMPDWAIDEICKLVL
jgi:hypothetical protein